MNGIAVKTSPIDCECQCSYSYYGQFCEINMCEHNPCKVGRCITNGSLSYTCDCPVGFQFMKGVYVLIIKSKTNENSTIIIFILFSF